MSPSPPFFLYDGECGFCQRWVDWLDVTTRGRIEFIPSQSVQDLARLGLTDEDVRTASYWVDDIGGLHRGNRSIANALQQGDGIWRVLGLALELPLIRTLAGVAYRWIARNRHRLPAPSSAQSLRPGDDERPPTRLG